MVLGYWLIQNFLNNEFIYSVLAFRNINPPHCLQSQKLKNFSTCLFCRKDAREEMINYCAFSFSGSQYLFSSRPFSGYAFRIVLNEEVEKN